MPPEKDKQKGGFDLVGIASILAVLITALSGIWAWASTTAKLEANTESQKAALAAHEAEDQRVFQRVFVTLDKIDGKTDKILARK